MGLQAQSARAYDLDEMQLVAVRMADAYAASQRWTELVELVERVGAQLNDSSARVALRRRAADACSYHLGDAARARQMWWQLLEDGDDREALERLLDDAIDRDDRAEATSLIERLSGAGPDDTLPGRAKEPRRPYGTLAVDDDVMDATDFVELIDT
jgi:hypothetical protein